ncbi:hypothetical protein QBC37DRAFT_424731 [Rhypophila decipiens]|uniref:Uncharacterized protein n=1 Tax=Rhypophila decipiens TaxID=261697 RepID=A0AAN7B6D1_9PEZI|nr:hypothetical protein QBC37DRAFT_424731 [Rhypophila decipiens]
MPRPGPVGLEPRVQHFKNMLRMAIMWWYLRPGAVFNAIISSRRPAPPPPPSNESTLSSISRYYLTWACHFTAWSVLYYLLVQNAESKKLKRRFIALSPSVLIAVLLELLGWSEMEVYIIALAFDVLLGWPIFLYIFLLVRMYVPGFRSLQWLVIPIAKFYIRLGRRLGLWR